MRKFNLLAEVFVLATAVLLGHPDTAAAQPLTLTPNPVVFSLSGPGATQTIPVSVSSSQSQLSLVISSISTSNGGHWLSASFTGSTLNVTVSNTDTMSPGDYTGSILVNDDISQGSGTLSVTLHIGNPSGGLSASPSPVTFLLSAPPTTSGSISQLVFLRFNGNPVPIDTATFTPTTGGISFVDLNIRQNGSVDVILNTAAKTNGVYAGNLMLTSVNGNITVPVTLTIGAGGNLAATPNPLNFSALVGGTAPTQTISVTSNGLPATVSSVSSTVSTTAQSWLLPTISSTPGRVTVAVNTTGLSAGVYNGTIVILTTQGAINVQVTLSVGVSANLQANPTILAFAYQIGADLPATQGISVTSSGNAVSFTASAITSNATGWLAVSPASQSIATPSTLTISVNPAGLAAGTYSGVVRIEPFGVSTGSIIDIPVTLLVSNNPILVTSPTVLSFTAQIGQNAASQNLSVNSSSTLLGYTATTTVSTPTGGSWLNVTNPIGSTSGIVVVGVNTQGLAAGVYSGAVNVSAPGSGNGSVSVPVTLTVTTGTTFQLTPSSLSFAYQKNQAAPANRAVSVGVTSGQLAFTVSAATSTGQNWLTISSTSGTAPGNFVVGINSQVATTLSAGTYNGTVSVSPSGSTAVQTIPVTLVVSDTALLVVNPTVLTFTAPQGSTTIPAQSVLISSTDTTPITFTVAPNSGSQSQNWLSLNQPTGPTPANVVITANPTGLAPGTYNGTVTVVALSPSNVANSPQNITVTLNVTATATLTASPTSLSFSQFAVGSTPESKALIVTASSGIINFTAVPTTTDGRPWLTVNPSTANTPGNLTVTANGSGLAAGNYSGSIYISSPGSANTQTVNVAMTVTAQSGPVIVLNPTTLSPVSYQIGDSNPATQTLAVSIAGGGAATFNASAQTSSGSWLTVSPTQGTTPANVTVTINPANLTAGTYSGTVSVAVAGAVTLNLPITLTVTPSTQSPPSFTSIQNGASLLFTALAPGLNIIISGGNMGPSTVVPYHVGTNGLFDTTVAGTTVLFDNVPAPVYYTSSTKVSVYVPYSVAGKTSTQVVVRYNGLSSAPQTYRVAPAAPGIFTLNPTGTAAGDGSGQGAIRNQDFSVNTATNPEVAGNYIMIYATGEGQTSPGGVDGAISPLRLPLPVPVLPVSVFFDGVAIPNADINYAGEAPGAISGHFQVNARLPQNLTSGAHLLKISVGGFDSQPSVIVNVKAKP